MAKLSSLNGATAVFFTDVDNGSRYVSLAGFFHVYVAPGTEADRAAVFDAIGLPYAEEPQPVQRNVKYGVELVGPDKLAREYLGPFLAGEKLPGEK